MTSEPPPPRSAAGAAAAAPARSGLAAHRLHPLGIAVLAAQRARAGLGTLVPALAAIGLGVGLQALVLALVAACLLGVVVGMLEWRAFTFGVEGAAFVVHRGIVRRETVSVPLARVQSVDVSQSPIARVLGARALTVRTAAGTENVELAAVSATAEGGLRAALGDAAAGDAGAEEVLARLPASRLPLIALTSPRIGAGIVVLVAVFQRLDEVLPGNLAGDTLRGLQPRSALAAVAEVAAAVLVAALASLAGTTLTWAGFRIVRDGPRLRLRRGLLSYRETVVALDRVRAVQAREGLPREALGLCTLGVRTAGRGLETGLNGTLHPLLALDRGAALVREAIPALDPDGIALRRPPRRARSRAIRRTAIPALVPVFAAAGLLWPWGAAALVLVPAAGVLGLAQWRAAGIGIAGDRLRWRRREVARYTLVARGQTVQWRRVRQGPLQRRRGLATLEAGLSVGRTQARVRDLDAADAARLARELGRPRTREHRLGAEAPPSRASVQRSRPGTGGESSATAPTW